MEKVFDFNFIDFLGYYLICVMHTEPSYLIMRLTEGFYGESVSIFNVHPMGYAEHCELFNEKCNSPWFCETFGIISDDTIKLISLDEDGKLICELTENEYGIIKKIKQGND